MDDENIHITLSDESHSIFQAHFPNNPLLPGFCHIEIVSKILREEVNHISTLKLTEKSFPNEEIIYKITKKEKKRKVKIIKNSDVLVGSFSYEC